MSNQKAQTNQRSAAEQGASVDVSVRVYPYNGKGPTLASVSVDLGGEYAIKGVRVVQGKDGPFVAMPQRQVNGEYQDVVFPVTKAARERLIDTVLTAYEQALEQEAKQTENQEPEQTDSGMTMSM